MEMIRAGRSLLLRAPHDTKPHLWFVLTDPTGTPPVIVAVMLRSAKAYTDSTLVLEPGDHPFVRHSSSVHYSSACCFPISRTSQAMAHGTCHLVDDMSPALLQRARDGLLISPFTVEALKVYCRIRF